VDARFSGLARTLGPDHAARPPAERELWTRESSGDSLARGMGALIFNAQTSLELRRSRGEVSAVTAAAPVRGRPLLPVVFSRAQDPTLCAFLEQVATRSGGAVRADLDAAETARLAGAGILVPEELAPRPPRFRCDPDDPPADLLPRPLALPPAPDAPLHVSEGFSYADAVGAPGEGLAPGLALLRRPRGEVNPFDDGCAWAFVDHPATAVPGTLSVPESLRPLFRRLQPGAPAPVDLTGEARAALARAGVLVDRAGDAGLRVASASARAGAAATFARDRHAVLPALLHSTQVAALRRYYRALVGEGYLRFGDAQGPGRYVAHNEPLARFFHRRLAGLVSEVAGEPVRPSYVFFASYRAGAEVPPHRDRAQCAFTVSLLVDHTPEPCGPSPWPLWLDADPADPAGRAVALGLGDGLLFLGIELRHWREALPDGHASTSLLFHYVPAAFAGTLD
jgi:hypothetical protein